MEYTTPLTKKKQYCAKCVVKSTMAGKGNEKLPGTCREKVRSAPQLCGAFRISITSVW